MLVFVPSGLDHIFPNLSVLFYLYSLRYECKGGSLFFFFFFLPIMWNSKHASPMGVNTSLCLQIRNTTRWSEIISFSPNINILHNISTMTTHFIPTKFPSSLKDLDELQTFWCQGCVDLCIQVYPPENLQPLTSATHYHCKITTPISTPMPF